MALNNIRKIKIEKFRGATSPLEIDFEPKKIVMIFGENGTGKSTIIDAIDFIFNRELGSLKERSSVKPKEHLPSLNSSTQDVKVFINNADHEWSGTFDGKAPVIINYENALSVKVLRRDKILKMVNAAPNKRYEAIKGFIDIPKIESSEKALSDAIRDIKKDIDDSVKNKVSQEGTLEKTWSDEGKPDGNYLSWAKNESVKDSESLKKETQDLEKIIRLIQENLDLHEASKKFHETLKESKSHLSKSEKELKDFENSNLSHSTEVVRILQETKSFLEESDPKDCPVCEQTIDGGELKKRINERLSQMSKQVTLLKKRDSDRKAVEDAEKNYKEAQRKLSVSTEKVSENNFFKNQKKSSESIDAMALRLKGDYESKDKSLKQLNLIRNAFLSLKKLETEVDALTTKQKFLEEVFKIMEVERKMYTESILDHISKDIAKLYSSLHPNERVGEIKLYLKSKVKGSLEMSSNFQDKEGVPPQAYYSDSHLDTLGVCIFISLAKNFKNDVIVLDDVVTSVDQPHMQRFVEMICNESDNFDQVILTTHYRPWREEYKFHRHGNANIQLIELAPWNIYSGIRTYPTKLALEELKEIKDKLPLERQIVASKSGVFLESVLDHLTLLYQLPLPRKSQSHYTIGEFLSSFKKSLKDQLKITNTQSDPITEEMLGDDINDFLSMSAQIRNQIGCHWNQAGMELSDQDVILFAESVISFGEKLICKECGALPSKIKDGSWQCSCGAINLYPVEI